jgi:hypothetical protein
MATLLSLVDNKGRINYEKLKDFISVTPLSQFTEQVQRPFLVGKKLYDGEIRKKSESASPASTLRFSASDLKEELEKHYLETKTVDVNTLKNTPPEKATGISSAIFYLRKKPYSTEPDKNVITVGRTEENDIVIPDYAISKRHAKIYFFKDMHFVVDLNSTNGTAVNDNKVKPDLKVQLSVNSTVAFGRICFVFTHPFQLYRGLRKEILGM